MISTAGDAAFSGRQGSVNDAAPGDTRPAVSSDRHTWIRSSNSGGSSFAHLRARFARCLSIPASARVGRSSWRVALGPTKRLPLLSPTVAFCSREHLDNPSNSAGSSFASLRARFARCLSIPASASVGTTEIGADCAPISFGGRPAFASPIVAFCCSAIPASASVTPGNLGFS